MSTVIFILLCLALAIAAYPVLRAITRSRRPYRELAGHLIPLSEHARAVLVANRSCPSPATWIEVADLWRVHENSAWGTMMADQYRRVMRACTDEESVAEMDQTYRTWLGNHRRLTYSWVAAIVNACFGKISSARCSAYMDNVARYYTNELILLKEMSEVMDESCIAVLEGQFGT
jgi:hypothetical protein